LKLSGFFLKEVHDDHIVQAKVDLMKNKYKGHNSNADIEINVEVLVCSSSSKTKKNLKYYESSMLFQVHYLLRYPKSFIFKNVYFFEFCNQYASFVWREISCGPLVVCAIGIPNDIRIFNQQWSYSLK